MASFSPAGVEFVAKNISGYLSDLSRVDKAQQALGKSAASVGSQFASAHTGASSFASRIGSMVPGIGNLASALGGVATVAGGIVAAQVFNKIVEGVGAFVSTGLEAVDAAQRLETGLGALLTMNNLYERTTETLSVATMSASEWAEAQTEAAKKSDDLAFKQRELTAEINTQNASIQEQRQRIIQMADGLDKNQQIARLQEMEIALEGMNRELAETSTEQGKLNNLTQEYTSVTETSFKQVMGFAEAQELAAKQSKDLLHFVEKLAIVSPFEQDQVAIVAKLATAAGLGVETTKNFTAGFLDLAAAVGIGSDGLTFAADQLLQVAKIGKITTVDLRQLRRLGIDLEKIIGTQMGMSIEEFNAEAAKSPDIFNKLFEAVTEFSQNTFAGTAEKMATSLSGLQSTFSDIFSVGAKNMLRPLVEAIGPMASEMLGRLSDMVTGPEMAKIGEAIPRVLFGAFQSLTGGEEGGLFSGLKGLGLSSSVSKEIIEITDMIGNLASRFREAFLGGGIQGVFNEFGAMIREAWTTTIQPQLFTWRDQFFNWVKGLYPQIPGVLTGLVNQITAFLRDNWPTIQASLTEWATKFWEWTNAALSQLGAKMAAILAALTAWATSAEAQTALTAMGQELGQIIYRGLQMLFENHAKIAEVLLKLVAGLLAAVAVITADLIVIGAQIVAGILSGMLEEMGVSVKPAMISELQGMLIAMAENAMTIIREVAKKIVKALADNLRAAWRAGMDLTEEFTEFLDNARQKIAKPEFWLEIGASIIGGILEGIKKNQAEVLEMLKELAKDAIQAAKDAIGFGSPAKEFMTIGESMVEGMLVGAKKAKFTKRFIDDLNMGGIARQLGTGGGQWRNFRNIIKNEIGASFEQLMTSGMSAAQVIDKIQKVAAKLNFPPSFASEFAMANGLIEHLTSSVTEFQKAMRLENMGNMVQMGGQFASLGSSFSEILKGELEGTEDQIQEFRDFLASGNQTFARKIKVDIGSGQMEELQIIHNRITAQLELNQLLAEQRRQQQLITQQQKSQEQLSFLQQQIELIKMGKEVGGNVFKGITFGLNASVEDLLAATNNVVTAMVNQINEDLQISSPSRVMAKIGHRVIEGMAMGLDNGRAMLDRAIGSTPLLNGSLMQPLAQPAYASGNTYNTTYEMPMTVHTTASAQATIRQYEVKRSMYAS